MHVRTMHGLVFRGQVDLAENEIAVRPGAFLPLSRAGPSRTRSLARSQGGFPLPSPGGGTSPWLARLRPGEWMWCRLLDLVGQLESRDLAPGDRRADHPLGGTDPGTILPRDEGEGNAFKLGPSRAADTMCIGLGRIGNVEIDHV